MYVVITGGGNERNNRDVVGLISNSIDRAVAAGRVRASRFPSCPVAYKAWIDKKYDYRIAV